MHFPIVIGLAINLISGVVIALEEGKTTMVTNLPSLAAEYETVTADNNGKILQRSLWRFWRQPNRVETRELTHNTGEVWLKAEKGQIYYERLFHNDKSTIEYYPDDLRATQTEPKWEKIAILIDPTLLGNQLKYQNESTLLNHKAKRFSGQVNNIKYNIQWLEQEQLPGEIQQIYPDRTISITLKELHPLATSPWPYDTNQKYRSIDYADIGDMESDPFIQKVLNVQEHQHHH